MALSLEFALPISSDGVNHGPHYDFIVAENPASDVTGITFGGDSTH